MTFESALPYVSIGCAIGAGAAAAVGPSPGVQRTLKSIALLTLAVFAFLRGVAPAAMAMALVLSGLGWATATRARITRASLSVGLFVLAWLVLAWLCLREGGGAAVMLEPFRIGEALLAIAVLAFVIAWSRRAAEPARPAALVQIVALGLLVATSLTLRDSQWPAMAGALGLFVGQAVELALDFRPQPRFGRAAEILLWLSSYLGQAAMAYVFLR